MCTDSRTHPPFLILICRDVSELSEDTKFVLQSLQYGLHNKEQREGGSPAEAADTVKMFLMVER